MLHIVAWGCTWHGCWIEGNNHKYEGRNEREKHFYINTCFNILKHHSSEEYICPYTSLRLLVCWLTWLVTKQHTYEWSKIKTSVHPFVGYHLLHPWYSPIYYTPWLSLSLLHIFEPFGYHSYISFPLFHPLATTHSSLFPYYTPFTYFGPFGYHSYIPFLLYYTPFTYFEPFGYHSYIPFLIYYTPFTYIFEPFGYHSYIPFPLLHHKQLNAIFLPWKSWALWVCENSISFFQLFFGPGNNI